MDLEIIVKDKQYLKWKDYFKFIKNISRGTKNGNAFLRVLLLGMVLAYCILATVIGSLTRTIVTFIFLIPVIVLVVVLLFLYIANMVFLNKGEKEFNQLIEKNLEIKISPREESLKIKFGVSENEKICSYQNLRMMELESLFIIIGVPIFLKKDSEEAATLMRYFQERGIPYKF